MRRAWLKIIYGKKDITEDISPFLKSFTYNDVMSGEADDVNITLEDREELWQNAWLPQKGDTLKISILTKNWFYQDELEKELKLGSFEIDEIEISSPPNEVKIKGISIPDNAKIKGEDKNRSWEKTKLSVIALDIANGADMELFYDTAENPTLDRVEQVEQSDLAFLMKICKDAGLALKISDNKIIIFDEEKYEQAEPVKDIEKGGAAYLKSYSLRSKTCDVYAGCRVKYKNAKNKELIEFTHKIPGKSGKILQVNEEVANYSEAEKLAKKKLREKNKEEITVTMQIMGDFSLAAGLTINLKKFNVFDGKYIIDKATHSIGGGYTTTLDLRRCLDGY